MKYCHHKGEYRKTSEQRMLPRSAGLVSMYGKPANESTTCHATFTQCTGQCAHAKEGKPLQIKRFGCVRHIFHWLWIGHSSTEVYPQKVEEVEA